MNIYVSINECLVEKKKCCLTKKLLNSKYLKITHYMVEKHCRYISSKLGEKKNQITKGNNSCKQSSMEAN